MISRQTEQPGIHLQGIGMTSQRTRDRLINRLREQGIQQDKVLEVMANTPRHLFIDEALAHRAYEDTALPIGHNQTISQPYIVAKMTELLLGDVVAKQPKKVLEIGTGCGYQTSVLAGLVDSIYSVERIKPLQDRAKQTLKTIGIKNAYFKYADGGYGWPDKAPFDGIIVTAAPEAVPEELKQQLAIGGRLIIPVGGETQQLFEITRTESGFRQKKLEPVKFVPMLAGKR